MNPLERFQDRLDTIFSIKESNGIRQSTKETLTESDLTNVQNLLKIGAKKEEWAKRPRLFAVLYMSGCMQDPSIMDQFVQMEYKDIDLPFGDPLPTLLKSFKTRNSFKENQKKIFTGVGDLEKGKGHQSFENGDKYYAEGRLLGQGHSAWVYEVFSKQSFETFARKMVTKPKRHEDAVRISQYVADEVEHLKRLSHRHLIKFVGSYTDLKYIAILMQPVARCNLLEFLSQSPLPAGDQSRLPQYFGCLAIALQYIHENGLKHKDLKPGNILVSDEGKVLITDFGSATSFWETGQSTTMGPEFSFTEDYAPREVVDRKPRNTKVDVYSLGCVFYEMWTVWKGESILNMKLYFAQNGSNWSNIRTNRIAATGWLTYLKSLPGHGSYMNKPIEYIQEMIQDDPKDRPEIHEIVEKTVGRGQTSRFCCPECMARYSDDDIYRRFHASPAANTSKTEVVTPSVTAELSLTPVKPESKDAISDAPPITTNPEVGTPPVSAESSLTTSIPESQAITTHEPSSTSLVASTMPQGFGFNTPEQQKRFAWFSHVLSGNPSDEFHF